MELKYKRMTDFLYELNRYGYKDDTFNGVELNAAAVSEYRNDLERLYMDYFSKIEDHINTLSIHKSAEDIKKCISAKKEDFKRINENQTDRERRSALNEVLSVEGFQMQLNIDKETAIQKRNKSICVRQIHAIQMEIIKKSLLRIMALHRKYCDDLLFELRRFDVEDFGYNDIPFEDIFNESDAYMRYFSRLFNGYFSELYNKIEVENDFSLINTKIKLFNHIKTELSEKKQFLFDLEKKNQTVEDRMTYICVNKAYNKQHDHINNALNKLEIMSANYNSSIKKSNAPQPKLQENKHYIDEYFEKHFDNKDITNKEIMLMFGITRPTVQAWREEGKLIQISEDGKRPIYTIRKNLLNILKMK